MESRRLVPNFRLLVGCLAFFIVIAGCGDDDENTDSGAADAAVGYDPYCDTRPQFEFCEDFDTRDLPGVFEEQSIELGEMSVADGEATSLPRSLLVNVQAGGSAVLKHQFGSGGKLRLFGMLYVPELGDGEVEIAAFAVGSYRVAFGVASDGSLWARESDTPLIAEGMIPVGRWASFRWDVNLYDDGTGSAKLRFGNDFIVNSDALAPPTDVAITPIASVGLSQATGAWTMRFDDLTVEVKELTP